MLTVIISADNASGLKNLKILRIGSDIYLKATALIVFNIPEQGRKGVADSLEIFTDINAHDVIGQEFSKVAFVMNSNFKYDENGKLLAASSYYSATGMLYQIVTRVVDELKILVLDNPDLYFQLLRIKNMGEIDLSESDSE